MSKKKKQQSNIYESKKSIFVIPQFVKIEGLRSGKKFESSEPISPIFGRKVKNIDVPANKVVNTGDVDTRYDTFRDEDSRKVSAEERAKYKEFTNIHTDESREEFLGSPVHKPINETKEESLQKTQIIKPIGVTSNKVKPVEKGFYNDFDEEEVVNRPNYPGLNITKDNNEVDNSISVNPFSETNEPLETFTKPWLHPLEDIVEETTISKIEEPIIESKPTEDEPVIITRKQVPKGINYKLPSVKMFSKADLTLDDKPEWLLKQVEVINSTLAQFAIEGRVVGTKKGPTVTRYEISLEPGISVKRVSNLSDNLMMNLAAQSIRIEAPIPGKPYVGIEVPNEVPEIVKFGNVVDNKEFLEDKNPLKIALGVDIDGQNIYSDINKMPHGLIAGATNSGKSVCVNTILVSLLLRNTPTDLQLILIDPKMVELQPYNDLPHLITPVITDAKLASSALKWAVDEMEKRYRLFAQNRSRDITSFNDNVLNGTIELEKMPRIVIVIDELADLMIAASQDVEESIRRLTAKARAAGIHLLVATQRPTTDVVSGTIKSNIPTRIAFKVASFVDSTTILDGQGAETLLGKGDMLFKENDQIIRLQGAWIPDEEIYRVTDYIRANSEPNYIYLHEELKQQVRKQEDISDELFRPVAEFVIEQQNASINSIQKEFNVGFNRAKTLMDSLEAMNIVSESTGTKAREVLLTFEELQDILSKYNL